MQPADTPAPEAPRPEDIDAVGDEANRLEERAEDDGVLPKPRDRYNFGLAADAIFRPCDDEEGCPLDPHLYLDDAFHAEW